MKKTFPVILTIIASFLVSISYAQDFEVVYVIKGKAEPKAVDNAAAINFTPDKNKIIKINAKSGDYDVFSDKIKLNTKWKQKADGKFEFNLGKAEAGKPVEVKKSDGTIVFSFTLPVENKVKTPASKSVSLKQNLMSPYEEAFENAYEGSYVISDYGITIDNRINGGYEFGGPDFSHIFIDEFGNTIKTTVPQGLADQIYVVHIIYMVPKGEDFRKIYAIKQTKGRFNPALRAENSEKDMSTLQSAEDYDIYEKTYSLSKSTDDIEFDLTLTDEEGTKSKIESFKISMSPSYHWSIHAGLLNTWLSNPTYQVLDDPQNPGVSVLKRSGFGGRGVVTVSATLYTSPFTLIRYAVQKQKLRKGKSSLAMKNAVPKSQKWGKNYLYERSFLDRIYPTIGVGLRDKTFENLFGGFNIEFARGGYLFAGIHYGKVSYFDKPDNFEFGKTPITQAEFDLRKDEKWRVNFALGVNVDFIILSSLFK